MKVGIIGPHGSGNRLLQRTINRCFDGLEVSGRSFPRGRSSSMWYSKITTIDGETVWDPYEADFYLVTMRERSPECIFKEGYEGVTSLAEARDVWGRAYRQIYRIMGPFWDRDDVHMFDYRDFPERGTRFVVDQIAEALGVRPTSVHDEMIHDGDEQYGGRLSWSREDLIAEIKAVCR